MSMEVVLFPSKTFARLFFFGGLGNRCKTREMADSIRDVFCLVNEHIGLYGLYKLEMIVTTNRMSIIVSQICSCLVICRLILKKKTDLYFAKRIVGAGIHPKYRNKFSYVRISEPSEKKKSLPKVFGDKFNGTTVEEILAQVGEGTLGQGTS